MSKENPSAAKQADHIDAYVGRQLRARRKSVRMSQEKLADRLGITFQQVQKYERGANRIGASRLYNIARVFDVPVTYFFPAGTDEGEAAAVAGFAEGSQTAYDGAAPAGDVETLDVVRTLHGIADPGVRHSLFEVIRAVAKTH